MHSFYEIKIKMHSSFLFILLGPIIIHTHTYALTFILHGALSDFDGDYYIICIPSVSYMNVKMKLKMHYFYFWFVSCTCNSKKTHMCVCTTLYYMTCSTTSESSYWLRRVERLDRGRRAIEIS